MSYSVPRPYPWTEDECLYEARKSLLRARRRLPILLLAGFPIWVFLTLLPAFSALWGLAYFTGGGWTLATWIGAAIALFTMNRRFYYWEMFYWKRLMRMPLWTDEEEASHAKYLFDKAHNVTRAGSGGAARG